MKKASFDLNLTAKRTVLSRSCASFCYYRHADGTRGVNFQMLTPQSKVNYELEETKPGVVSVTTKSADRELLKKNGFVSMVNKTVSEEDHFFLAVNKVLKQVRALQREFGADAVKISTIFHWTEL
jgi:hypothetical protein